MSTVPVRAEEVGSWRRQLVQDALPLVSSLMVHVGIIVLGVVTYQAMRQITTVARAPDVIPEGAMDITSDDSFKALFPAPREDDPSRQFTRDDVEVFRDDAHGFGKTPTANIATMLASGGGSGDSAEDVIATGPNKGAFGQGKQGTGIGHGLDGAGTGDNGLARFGPGGGGTPTVQFFPNGPKAAANKVVFLCDSSGSMVPKFDALRQELRRAVDRLSPRQQFDIVFFAEERHEALDNQLLYALPENKRRAYEFLDRVSPHGSSNPIPGLRAAFATSPELIFVLTDGDFPNNEELLAEVKRLNAAKRVKINTIAFMDPGEAYEKLLNAIAAENQGTFKFVTKQDLQR
jgi:hypothetical protein